SQWNWKILFSENFNPHLSKITRNPQREQPLGKVAASAPILSKSHFQRVLRQRTQTAPIVAQKRWSVFVNLSEIVIFRGSSRAIPYSAPLRGAF
ncbi:MAG: hypothetical protein QF354_05190, partial [Candidatus Thalassarchaeum sp.]|nr:hypothetical protein [Candidatus Thalassarchaeum sp.]